MDWTLDKSRSISRQICEKFCVAIMTGEFQAGERLMSVREVALFAGVNPNTVQKSFEELERHGVIHPIPYSGWYVNENTAAAEAEVNALRRMHSENYLAVMAQLGYDPNHAIQYLASISQERTDSSHA